MNDLSRRRPLRSLLLAAALGALGAGRATADTIAAGQDFAGAIDSGGVLRTWGKNASGQLGLGSTTSSVSQPMPVSGIWKHVAMGQDFTLAISTADELWAWGNNTSGQLGTGGTASSSSPVRVSTSNFPAGSVVRAVAAGQNFAVALVDAPGDAGRIYAWGDNSLGQLGQGDTTARSTPALVNAATRRYSAITATRFETAVAIATDGSLYAWGANTNGECAQNNPSTLSYTTPTRIGTQTGWTAVAGGLLHVLALRGNELYGWGANSSGQAGVPPTVTVISGIPFSIPVSTVTAPTRIAASQTWAAIGAGQLHSLAVDSTGALYGWGSNQLGQLALNITNTGSDLYTSPQLIGGALAPWAAAAGGLKFTVARTAAGAFYTVGSNDLGQLGNGTVDSNLNTTPSFGAASVGTVNLAVTAAVLPATTLGVNTVVQPVTVTVNNHGGGALTSSFLVQLYLSDDTVLDASDRLLATSTQAGPLASLGSRTVSFSSPDVAIPEIPPGTRTLISQASPVGAGSAVSPANGAGVSVTLSGPDLKVDTLAISGSTTVLAGTSFSGVTAVLRNVGVGAVAAGRAILVKAYLGTTTTHNASADIPVGQFTFTTTSSGLAPGASVTLPAQAFTVPAGSAGGSYQLLYTINEDGAVIETGTQVNTAALTVAVSSADLVVTAPDTGATTSLGVNTTVPIISTVVTNIGTQVFSAGYTVQLYLSTDATFSQDDTLLQTLTQSAALDVFPSVTSGILLSWSNVALPDATPGAYFLLSRVVLNSGQTDANAANNVAATAVTLVAPTLSLSNFVFPNTTSVSVSGSIGTFGNVTYLLSNTGRGAVPAGKAVSVEVFLSTDTVLDRAADPQLDQYSYVGGLVSGGGVTLPSPLHAISLPQGVLNGIYNLLFVVNGTGAVAGTSVTVTNQQVAVGALDASVTAPALSSTSLGVNTALPSTSVTVNNLGGFAIPAGTVVSLYLSTDAAIDLGDTLLSSQTVASSIAGGTSRSVTFTGLSVPDIGQGSFHLLAQLTLPGGLLDLNLANNVADTAVSLQRPNLAISAINAATTADLDVAAPSISGVSFSLDNTGLGAVSSSATVLLEVYLSSDSTLNPSTDTPLLTTSHSGGLGATGSGTASATIGPFSLTLSSATVGGNYYLIFVANRDAAVQESDSTVATVARQVFLQKTDAPGLAFDYGAVTFSSSTGVVQWGSVTDNRASGGTAFQSPSLSAGQTATLTMTVNGPTTVNAPWLIIGNNSDTVSYAIDGGIPADLSSGSLTVGETYQIVNYVAGDDFTGVGASANTTGTVFRATGTSPTWIMGSQLSIATLFGFQPAYKPKTVTVTTSGSHTVSWIYTQGSSSTASFARVDLDLPSFSTSGDGIWSGALSSSTPLFPAPSGTDSFVRSPTLSLSGQQAALQVPVTGPGVASFWWRAESDPLDTLSFYIDGELAELPTTTFFTDPSQAVISGSTAWANVAFLVGSGTHTLSWTYAQNSTNTASAVFLDGLQVSSPIPAANVINRNTDLATHAAVPLVNLDLALGDLTLPPEFDAVRSLDENDEYFGSGVFLLDDANGTGRMPVTISLLNNGDDFDATQLGNVTWPGPDLADLELHLSTNLTFGDSDDVNLGSFANLDTFDFGSEAIFDGEINLPFDIPSGDYYLLIRYAGTANTAAAADAEFTLANNTAIAGPYRIKRAPDLQIDNFSGLSSTAPYHPEDSLVISYDITNPGLGTVQPAQPFKVQVDLMGLALDGTDLSAGKVVKSYSAVTHRVFLPEVSGQYPDGGIVPVTHFLDIPSLRDTLAGLGEIASSAAEDSAEVAAKVFRLATYKFYFRITVDSENAIAESSETNTFYFGSVFLLSTVPTQLNLGQYFGQTVFSTLTNATAQQNPNVVLSNTTITSGTLLIGQSYVIWGYKSGDDFTNVGAAQNANGVVFTATGTTPTVWTHGSSVTIPAFASLVKDYALGIGITGSPLTVTQSQAQNGYPSLAVPPGGTDTYLTETFTFNTRADDVKIEVQASTDPTFATATTLITLTPPYGGTSGDHSLSGFGGLKDHPYVLAVDGNNTNVQDTYVARITVRDSVPAASASARFMRLSITPTANPPTAPTGFAVGTPTDGTVTLSWAGSTSGSFLIQRTASSNPSTTTIVGATTGNTMSDSSLLSGVTYTYSIQAVSSAGATTSSSANVSIP